MTSFDASGDLVEMGRWRTMRTVLAAEEATAWFGEAPETAATQPRITTAAYTSFDGDFIGCVPRMCLAAAMLDVLPLNPEAALGYFVSTTSLGNNKPAVMKACLAVQFKGDELWIFSEGGPAAFETLPEGVRAEYLLWRELRGDAPVRHFPWLDDDQWRQFLNGTAPADVTLSGAELDQAHHEQILASMDDDYMADLDARLLTSVRSHGLMPVVFISSADADDKHIDWARALAYAEGLVPFCTSTMFPKQVSDVLGHTPDERRAFRNDLIRRSDEFWLCCKPAAVESREFSQDLVDDVHAWLTSKPDGPVRIVDWAEAEVPKYTSADWALTTEEQREDEPRH